MTDLERCHVCGMAGNSGDFEFDAVRRISRCTSCTRARYSSLRMRLLGAFHMIVDRLAA